MSVFQLELSIIRTGLCPYHDRTGLFQLMRTPRPSTFAPSAPSGAPVSVLGEDEDSSDGEPALRRVRSRPGEFGTTR